MGFDCKIIADSISPENVRITTFQITFPRWMLAEFNTHRALSRNAASSRAIPVNKMIERLREDPYVPERPCVNQSGMQPGEPLSEKDTKYFRDYWLGGLDMMVKLANEIGPSGFLNVHKQWTNRLLEPWMWVTDVCTATEWENFFALRTDHRAAYDFQKIAAMMYLKWKNNEPQFINYGQWHLPYVEYDDLQSLGSGDPTETFLKMSTARCARVSYLNQEGTRELQKDLDLYERLVGAMPRHSSPAEHQATPALPDDSVRRVKLRKSMNLPETCEPYIQSNFRGWNQHRKFIINECVREFEPTQQEIDRWCNELGIDENGELS